MALELTHLAYGPEGAETGPPLLIAHGLFGQARNFHTLARRLATGRRVIAVDMRNHGASPHDPEMTYPAMADDLAGAIRRHCDGAAVVLGHSMGGKAAMTLALTEPGLVRGLIVADIAPVAYTHSHLPYIRAMKALDLGKVRRRADADAALAGAIPDPMLRGFLLQGLSLGGGEPRWRFNLDALESGMESLVGFPDTLAQARYCGPTLVLRGGASDYVAPGDFDEIRARFPAAEIETIDGAGHWLHAEQPDAFLALTSAWLDLHGGQIHRSSVV